MLQTAVRDIKSAIGDICISMHRKSKEDEVFFEHLISEHIKGNLWVHI